jgi:hypothetical protein
MKTYSLIPEGRSETLIHVSKPFSIEYPFYLYGGNAIWRVEQFCYGHAQPFKGPPSLLSGFLILEML